MSPTLSSLLHCEIRPTDFGPTPQPFNISVSSGFIHETEERVNRFRPSLDLEDDSNQNWSDGPPSANVTALAKYWAEDYEWKEVQDKMNSDFSHFSISLPGVRGYDAAIPLHFVHERSQDEDATPLLLLHGWPSTHLEWEKVIHPLVSPQESKSKSYHVVAPDLPGFGFSPAPTQAGLDPRKMGLAMDALMLTLGYKRYGIVTTDLGWQMGMWMVEDVSDHIIGHMTDFFIPQPTPADMEKLQKGQATAQEAEYLGGMQGYMGGHAAYATVQSQKPLALATAMADSPVGYAAWIWHLMYAVSDGYEYSHEELVTSTMMLWLQGPYGNLRTYKEFYKPGFMDFPTTKIPTGVSQWLNPKGPYAELKRFPIAPRDWIERVANVVYMSSHEFGGHFPATSHPEIWVDDTRNFFALVGEKA
ncbi:alpha/beta-hydrolase [Sarocladium strictum]